MQSSTSKGYTRTMNTAQIIVENVRADLDRVLFTTPEAQRRYLERLEARLFGDLMDAKPAHVERLAVAHDLVATSAELLHKLANHRWELVALGSRLAVWRPIADRLVIIQALLSRIRRLLLLLATEAPSSLLTVYRDNTVLLTALVVSNRLLESRQSLATQYTRSEQQQHAASRL